jgi:hypothetical protein
MALSFVHHPASLYSVATVNQPRTGGLPALRGRAARISRAPTLLCGICRGSELIAAVHAAQAPEIRRLKTTVRAVF